MSSDHWPQFYQHQQSPPTIFSVAGDAVSDSTVVTTSAPTAATASTTGHHLTIPEGRVAKPVRRRPRASRRTPTTLLNTDTTNFRAMVQQFTGGPSGAPFGTASSQLNTHSFSFAMNNNNNNTSTNPRQGHVNPGGVMINPNSGFHIQYQNQNQHHQISQQHPYMFSLGVANSSSTGGGQGDHDFFHRISSGTAEEGVPAVRAPPSSENRSNSFLF